MIGKKPVAMIAVGLALFYAASPYVALYRLMGAIRAGDERVLESAVDWESVRTGLKQDIAEGLVGDLTGESVSARAQLALNTIGPAGSDATPSTPGDGLPPFGASFISGIAGSMVDREVTPRHLALMMRQLSGAEPDGDALVALGAVRHAFFAGPASFDLRVLCPGQEAGDEPLRVRLELRGGGWTIVRAWVPQDLIDLANART